MSATARLTSGIVIQPACLSTAGIDQNQVVGSDDIADAADQIQRLLHGTVNFIILRLRVGLDD